MPIKFGVFVTRFEFIVACWTQYNMPETLEPPKCHLQKLHGQSADHQAILSRFPPIKSFKVLISFFHEIRQKQLLGMGLKGPQAAPHLVDDDVLEPVHAHVLQLDHLMDAVRSAHHQVGRVRLSQRIGEIKHVVKNMVKDMVIEPCSMQRRYCSSAAK
jgi:hypothetical protein